MHDDFMNAAMQFNSETLEPLYKLVIGKSGESNALWIANKMSVKEHVLKRAKEYMGNKEYALEKVNESKIRKPKFVQEKRESHYEYKIGDRVNLLDHDDFGIIYKEKDNFYNVVVYYNGELVEVNVKRITLEVAAKELYPEGYDLNTLFVDYKERKMQHDIERGSKKALRKIQKEIRKNRG